ncbi:imidazole glycerol phosphate synthase subunit HisH [Polynucleobacter paneuropaeus]|uniref:Imidazole glycerol phosphate synthase subunit HisH n=1 Tax=Polynucleobacter paneuropaeus TaxID=2527775 RepID=A0A9Q2ZWR5_9BURK|nr:imidazole glycerol phosphate synthase subunit HisH [Polynucleobacter paneuropaeus]
MKIGVIDYGVGNLGSVIGAIEALKSAPILISHPEDLKTVDRYILPGVGSFTDCKAILDNDGWSSALNDQVLQCGKALLGICLGMQLLADSGDEGASKPDGTQGLGYIPGRVKSLVSLGCEMRVPHMGWNSLKKKGDPALLRGIPSDTDFYFVHSYAFVPDVEVDIAGIVNYGIDIPAVIVRGNIWGAQFHPEKSSRAGFKLLSNFLELP